MNLSDLLVYTAIAVGTASLVLNFLAWRKKPRRRWLYLVGMMAAAWVAISYLLLALGVVTIEFMTITGALRWGAIMGTAVTAAHAIVDT